MLPRPTACRRSSSAHVAQVATGVVLLLLLGSFYPAAARHSASRRLTSSAATTSAADSVANNDADAAVHNAKSSSNSVEGTIQGASLPINITSDTASTFHRRRLQQNYAPANCLNGWTITGECVTTTAFITATSASSAGGGGGTLVLPYSQRCTKWTPALVKRAALAAGCKVGSFLCGAFRPVCQGVCSAIASVAQAQCVDKREITTFIAPDLVKTSYVCCQKCSALDRVSGRCP